MLVWAVLAALLFFAVFAAAALLWARGQVGRQRRVDDRQRLLALAAQAATDDSGRYLLLLLGAMEQAGADCPITVEWLRREARPDHPGGMLVKIAWDGNEWRRIIPLSPFRERVGRWLAEDAACGSARGRQLLADLEA